MRNAPYFRGDPLTEKYWLVKRGKRLSLFVFKWSSQLPRKHLSVILLAFQNDIAPRTPEAQSVYNGRKH